MIDDNHEVPCLDFEMIEDFENEQKENLNWKFQQTPKSTKALRKISELELYEGKSIDVYLIYIFFYFVI